MVNDGVTEANVEVEGQEDTEGPAVDDLVDGVHAHVETSVADKGREGNSQEEQDRVDRLREGR